MCPQLCLCSYPSSIHHSECTHSYNFNNRRSSKTFIIRVHTICFAEMLRRRSGNTAWIKNFPMFLIVKVRCKWYVFITEMVIVSEV
uniref:Uncharacterized protein n=1 Tax=Pyxicephalus adspersus TaxID=30357 RepID=A0AAV3A4A8_PYXAD|nr:TPA: hypothetical protein GDO54_011759 [Pyxicephalus adspersus]